MALRAIFGFQHLPQGTTAGATATGYGLGYSGINCTTGTVSARTIYIEGNAIRMIATGSAYAVFAPRLLNIYDGVSPKAIFGYRFKHTGVTSLGTAVLTVAGVSVSRTELGAVGNLVEYLIEVVCDRATKEISFFVNGAFVVTKTATVVPLLPEQQILFYGGLANAPAWLSDFYFIDDTQDDTPCTRLGAVRVTPIDLTSAVGQDYTVSSGDTIDSALNTAYTTTASVTTPTVTSPTSQTPLAVGFETPLADPYAKIYGVVTLLDAQRGATTTPALDVSITDTVNTVSIGTIFFADDSWKYGSYTKVVTKAPDGMPFTAAKLAATKVVYKPKTAT